MELRERREVGLPMPLLSSAAPDRGASAEEDGGPARPVDVEEVGRGVMHSAHSSPSPSPSSMAGQGGASSSTRTTDDPAGTRGARKRWMASTWRT